MIDDNEEKVDHDEDFDLEEWANDEYESYLSNEADR